MDDTATDAHAFMSRTTGLPSHMGKATATLKASVPECVKEDFDRLARDLGFPSGSDFLRDIVMVRLYGAEQIRMMNEDRLRKAAGIGPVSVQKAESMPALPTIHTVGEGA